MSRAVPDHAELDEDRGPQVADLDHEGPADPPRDHEGGDRGEERGGGRHEHVSVTHLRRRLQDRLQHEPEVAERLLQEAAVRRRVRAAAHDAQAVDRLDLEGLPRYASGTTPVGWFGKFVTTVTSCPRATQARPSSSRRALGAPSSGQK